MRKEAVGACALRRRRPKREPLPPPTDWILPTMGAERAGDPACRVSTPPRTRLARSTTRWKSSRAQTKRAFVSGEAVLARSENPS